MGIFVMKNRRGYFKIMIFLGIFQIRNEHTQQTDFFWGYSKSKNYKDRRLIFEYVTVG